MKLVLGLECDLACCWKPSKGKPRCPTRRPGTAGGSGGRSVPIPGIHFFAMFDSEEETNSDTNVPNQVMLGANAYENSSGLFVVAIAGSGSGSNGDWATAGFCLCAFPTSTVPLP